MPDKRILLHFPQHADTAVCFNNKELILYIRLGSAFDVRYKMNVRVLFCPSESVE